MSKYRRLTLEDRYQIQTLNESKMSMREISRHLGRSPSTISRELRRNCTRKKYKAKSAANLTLKRREGIGPPLKISGSLEKTVIRLLCHQWSPEQICGRLSKMNISISHEAIYQYVYKDFKRGGNLREHLRRRRRYRYTWSRIRNQKTQRERSPHKRMSERPRIVDERSRFGDFERDTMLGQRNGSVLLTIVDRKSKLVKIKKVEKVNAMLTHLATVELLSDHKVRTITNDNGPEFTDYHFTEEALNTDIYFNRPYSSYERGTNENTNGLIRQYFPKGTNFNRVSEYEIKSVENLLNNRPRKTLGYRTPFEVHRG